MDRLSNYFHRSRLTDTASKMMNVFLLSTVISKTFTFPELCVAVRCEHSGSRLLLLKPDQQLDHIAQDQTGYQDGTP